MRNSFVMPARVSAEVLLSQVSNARLLINANVSTGIYTGVFCYPFPFFRLRFRRTGSTEAR